MELDKECSHGNVFEQGDTPCADRTPFYWDVKVCRDCGTITEYLRPTEDSEHAR